jgi:hypothetical protein
MGPLCDDETNEFTGQQTGAATIRPIYASVPSVSSVPSESHRPPKIVFLGGIGKPEKVVAPRIDPHILERRRSVVVPLKTNYSNPQIESFLGFGCECSGQSGRALRPKNG